jgi:hypothetical protein
VLLVFVGVLVVLAAGAAYAGYRYDRATAIRILPGVRIAGVEVGGMTRSEALRALAPMADSILDRTIEVQAGKHRWTVTPRELGTSVALDRAVDEAFSVQSSFGWPARVVHRLFQRPVDRTVDVSVSYDRDAVQRFAQEAAKEVERPARDASLDFLDGAMHVVHSRSGATLRASRAQAGLWGALRHGRDSVSIRILSVAPAVAESDLGKTIVIKTSINKLYLYDGVHLVKTYDVATGQPQYPTPLGTFEIINKRINPTWINPALDTWGKGEPPQIPPGPDNPLGTRALDLNAPGIRIHGTPNDASIGHAASHGCIRMHIPDSEDLFGRVDVGTRVIITTG